MPLFSVIIPTFNRAALLARTLKSVSLQTFTDYEVIVVDDGSIDETKELLGRWPCVKVVTQDNRGPGPARNAGAATAQGQYLAFLDSDDAWFPWSLQTYCSVIQDHGSLAFIAGKPFRFERDLQLAGVSAGALRCRRFSDYFASGDEWRWWGASSFVVRRDAFQTVEGFADEQINGEDADLAMRLGAADGFVQIVAPQTFGYREHAANIMKSHSKNLVGAWYQIRFEKQGGYPGGPARRGERREILTRHVRPVTLDCLARGFHSDAWRLYWAMFRWHLALGRWKYLCGFPFKAMFS